jgi:hypothetical protein
MINIKKFLTNVRKDYPTESLFEDTFASLKSMSDDGRVNRASGMTSYYQGISQGPDGQARTMWAVPSASDSKTKYQSVVEVVVPVDGGLFGVAKSKWDPRKFADTFKESDVRVSCTCPDFWWGGQTYNLGSKGKHKGNLASGANMTNLQPNIRDPKREHVLCKHLIAVFSVFPSNAFKIMGDARKFDANLETNAKATNDIEQGKAVLNKEKELFSIPDAGKDVITDALYKGSEELSKNQDNQGAEELIDERNEVTFDVENQEPSDSVDEIIDVDSQVDDIETIEEPAPEVGEMIEEKNAMARESDDVIGADEPIEDTEDIDVLEKDKEITEESEVSDDPNELLNRT